MYVIVLSCKCQDPLFACWNTFNQTDVVQIPNFGVQFLD